MSSSLTLLKQKVREKMGNVEKADNPEVLEQFNIWNKFHTNLSKTEKCFSKCGKTIKGMAEVNGEFAPLAVDCGNEAKAFLWGTSIAPFYEVLSDLSKYSSEQGEALAMQLSEIVDRIHSINSESHYEFKDQQQRYNSARLAVDAVQTDLNDLNKKDEKEKAKIAQKIKTMEQKLEHLKQTFQTVSAETVEQMKVVSGAAEADVIEILCDYYDMMRDYFQSMLRFYNELVPQVFEFRRHVQEAKEKRAIARQKGIYREDQMFGISLDSLLSIEQQEIPRVVQTVCHWIRANALKVENIFAAPAPPQEVAALKAQVDHVGRARVDVSGFVNPHTIATILKMFLRELPEPLATYRLFEAWIDINNVKEEEAKVKKLRLLVAALPTTHVNLFAYLTSFLNYISQYETFNKMSAGRLASAFAPCIMRQLDSTTSDTANTSNADSRATTLNPFERRAVLEFMILRHQEIFFDNPHTHAFTDASPRTAAILDNSAE